MVIVNLLLLAAPRLYCTTEAIRQEQEVISARANFGGDLSGVGLRINTIKQLGAGSNLLSKLSLGRIIGSGFHSSSAGFQTAT